MKLYEAELVRNVVTTDPSGTNSVRRTEIAHVFIEAADEFNPDHGPNGYDLLGEWRVVRVTRTENR
jgi:hypothetical protein